MVQVEGEEVSLVTLVDRGIGAVDGEPSEVLLEQRPHAGKPVLFFHQLKIVPLFGEPQFEGMVCEKIQGTVGAGFEVFVVGTVSKDPAVCRAFVDPASEVVGVMGGGREGENTR